MSLIEEVRYHSLFTFIFSKRPGTPAALMEDTESKEDISRRFASLLKKQEEISREMNPTFIGKEVKLLIEELGENDEIIGRSLENLVVHIKGSEQDIGNFVLAKITEFDGVLHGVRI